MKKTTTILAFVFAPIFLIGQNKSTIDAVFSTGFSYFNEKGEFIQDGTFFQLDTRREDDSGMAWRFGINLSQEFARDNFYEMGLHFVNINFTTGSNWFPTSNSDHSFTFLELPLAIRHELNAKKLSSYVKFGIAVAFHLDSSTSFSSFEQAFVDDYPLFNYVATLGGGFEYHFKESVNIYFQPTFRYNLIGIEISEYSKYHFYNFGVDIGVRGYL